MAKSAAPLLPLLLLVVVVVASLALAHDIQLERDGHLSQSANHSCALFDDSWNQPTDGPYDNETETETETETEAEYSDDEGEYENDEDEGKEPPVTPYRKQPKAAGDFYFRGDPSSPEDPEVEYDDTDDFVGWEYHIRDASSPGYETEEETETEEERNERHQKEIPAKEPANSDLIKAMKYTDYKATQLMQDTARVWKKSGEPFPQCCVCVDAKEKRVKGGDKDFQAPIKTVPLEDRHCIMVPTFRPVQEGKAPRTGVGSSFKKKDCRVMCKTLFNSDYSYFYSLKLVEAAKGKGAAAKTKQGVNSCWTAGRCMHMAAKVARHPDSGAKCTDVRKCPPCTTELRKEMGHIRCRPLTSAEDVKHFQDAFEAVGRTPKKAVPGNIAEIKYTSVPKILYVLTKYLGPQDTPKTQKQPPEEKPKAKKTTQKAVETKKKAVETRQPAAAPHRPPPKGGIAIPGMTAVRPAVAPHVMPPLSAVRPAVAPEGGEDETEEDEGDYYDYY